MTKAIAYYRVSTAKQGASGLGLGAQEIAVLDLCDRKGWDLIAPPFTDVMSSRRKDRPELAKALERCKQTGARLVIAKTDRLMRDLETLVLLEGSGVEFTAADNPEANRLTIRLLVMVAQEERDAVSQRTRDALAVAKARGCHANGESWKHGRTKLGNPMGASAFRGRSGAIAGAKASKLKADAHAAVLSSAIDRIRSEGHSSLSAIARELNKGGEITARGGKWYATSVRNLLARY